MLWGFFAKKWMMCGAVVVSLGAALWLQTARLKAARTVEIASARIAAQWRSNFEAMEATNAANVAALEKLQTEAARIEGIAAVARAANATQAIEIENLRRKLRHVPPSDDGPVRPVLCDTVNELRRLAGESTAACGG